ncbi:smalltalk protein [Bacteroides sp. OttesenSCG-928-J23]|nr:smalltalk protein [Bacteroides sp. OttesenSCG-928-J23]
MKVNRKLWDVILKAVIAVCSALAGALGAQAMNL